MIPDYHLHTEFSGDCETKVLDVIKTAVSKGMNSICITDHNDLDFPDTPDDVNFDLNIDEYIRYMTDLRLKLLTDEEIKHYVGHDSFDLRIGVEQGVMPTTCETLNSYSKDHPGLDFIICSSHVVDGMDPYYPEYFEGKKETDAYRHYFETILYNVEHFNDHNVYGHIDYIFRYGPTKAENYKSGQYHDILEPAFKKMIYDGKGLEINTGSLYRGMDYMHPHDDILRLYKDLGGEIITVGSDAHDDIHVGHAFKEAGERLLSFGFKYYCTFNNMKPTFQKID